MMDPFVRHTGKVAALPRATQDRPDEAVGSLPKPGEPDTETEAGYPKEAPESKQGEQQSKQDQ